MTNAVETLIAEFDQKQRELASAFYSRLRALCASQLGPADLPDRGLNDLIPAADAADLARRAKSTMGAWCRRHPIDAGGFAVKIGTRWFVSKSRLISHLENARSSGSRD